MAVEPSSDQNTRVNVSGGNNPTSSDPSSMAPGWVRPRNEQCANASSCRAMAALIRGWLWPWRLVQIEELPSRYSRPRLSRRVAPWPETMTSGSWSGAHQSRICVKGCHWCRRSASIQARVSGVVEDHGGGPGFALNSVMSRSTACTSS